ncbi:WAP four-disulfide core domain protein 10A-like [Hyaena hyaena]|uniref:WAP four-disulfide core domain protein 10A-like n=1 Tax=Hyaena hyaena TaxID=95912 RepID=UPI0019220732|nr:WAP four-disulfide core domain protein 10A-like [Hyaena hyaena]
MKWLFLQLLTLCCLVILPVAGSFKSKTETTTPSPKFIKPTLELLRCVEAPTHYDCKKKCDYHSDCSFKYECCYSNCGKICMRIPDSETSNGNYAPITVAAVTSYLTTSPENDHQLSEWYHNNTT